MDEPGDTNVAANSEISETEMPQNPGLSTSELTRVGLQLLNEGTLAYLAYGSGSLSDCYQAVSSAAPVFRRTQADRTGIGLIGGMKYAPWLGFESDEGSVIAYLCFSEGDSKWGIENILFKLKNLPDEWHSDICTSGRLPAEVVHILHGARAVPVWEVADFEHTDSSGQT
jgi:hypothetical protein